MYRSQPLHPDCHDVSRLHSGAPSLDGWLRDHAASAETRRVSRTFVWVNEHDTVVAFYSLAAHELVRDALPRSIGHGLPAAIPAVLLGRLALDRSVHGQGLGGALLAEALGRVVRATQHVAARFVVVDALDESAARFYEHHGFRRIPGTLRLVQRVRDIEAALTQE